MRTRVLAALGIRFDVRTEINSNREELKLIAQVNIALYGPCSRQGIPAPTKSGLMRSASSYCWMACAVRPSLSNAIARL